MIIAFATHTFINAELEVNSQLSTKSIPDLIHRRGFEQPREGWL